jgi:NAD(P)-dependent dehydrogenase (short-subunit alcohol dehydrogenase family)
MRRVLITGAASGFGQALARIYAARGDRVLLTDLALMAAEVDLPPATNGGEVFYSKLDVRSDADWERVRREVEDRWGGLDLLFNNAGVAAGGRIDVVPIKDWEWIVDINLLGVVRGCQTFTPMFKRQGSGHIVNTASLAGLVHGPGMSSYNAVKAGVVALSETLLHELAPFGIAVSVICPSFFRTKLDRSLPGSDPALEADAVQLITRARRSAEQVAARAVRQVDKLRFLILVDAQGHGLTRFKRLTPRAYHAALMRVGTGLRKRTAQRERESR